MTVTRVEAMASRRPLGEVQHPSADSAKSWQLAVVSANQEMALVVKSGRIHNPSRASGITAMPSGRL
jgi:hypothetical protein